MLTDVDLALQFFVQLTVILVACRLVGYLGKRYLGQAQVVGEMITGVLLGPSLLGALAPGAESWLFPKTTSIVHDGLTMQIKHPSMSILYVVGQLGLVLYMFVVGLEFDLGALRKRGSSAFFVSASGILAPMLMGGVLALVIADKVEIFTPHISSLNGALYLGAAMSITAFPMLARLLYEKQIIHTSMGTLALAAGAFDDAVAWVMLAVVLALAKSDPLYVYLALGGGSLYVIAMLTIGRRWLAFLGDWTDREGSVTQPILAVTCILLMIGAFITDSVGIYAVFGAFIMGASMPKGAFSKQIGQKLGDLTAVVLLPLFFVFSGLNAKIGLINSPALWLIALLIMVIAILGKGGACLLAARASGESWRDSAAIGTLMNSRGLMELIILNIGLQQGVITPTLFTMMVLMALATTVMASPIFDRLAPDADKDRTTEELELLSVPGI